MTLRNLYEELMKGDDSAVQAVELSSQLDWFTTIVEFDPASGQELPMPLSKFLIKSWRYQHLYERKDEKKVKNENECFLRDRLYRIVQHARLAIERILRSMNESPAREHADQNYMKVREMDTSCFVKLMTRPGRNMREKIAVKPIIPSVRRFQSIDVAENRLFKEFLLQLLPLLELRQKVVHSLGFEKKEPLIEIMSGWLYSDEAREISRWQNTPPNNTMLSHPDYRLIWDAWGWLQTLDADTNRDYLAVEKRRDLVSFWQNYVVGWKRTPCVKLIEVPLVFDYDAFDISPWGEMPLPVYDAGIRLLDIGNLCAAQEVSLNAIRDLKADEKVDAPICVDLTCVCPSYASNGHVGKLRTKLLWQRWNDSGRHIDMPMFAAEAVWQKDETETIALGDLFCADYCKSSTSVQELAARRMIGQLKAILTCEQLVWLVPDICSDFELRTIRRNINAAYSGAMPLPMSVAAAIELCPYEAIPYPGYTLVVVDEVCGRRYATCLRASMNELLRQRLPETRGYYWERQPAVMLSDDDKFESGINWVMPVLDADDNWHGRNSVTTRLADFTEDSLCDFQEVRDHDAMIVLKGSPVLGGLRYLDLLEKCPDVVLWRDHLPVLSVEVLRGGRYTDFYLVSENTNPLSYSKMGERIKIEVPDRFSLPVAQEYYSLPLHQGAGRKQLKYNAYLKPNHELIPSDPSQKEISCTLILYYTYGADDPYELYFVPAKGETYHFDPIKVEWKKSEAGSESVVLSQLPVPQFPSPYTWADFQHFPSKKGEGQFDNLLEGMRKRLLGLGEVNEDAYLDDYFGRKVFSLRKKRKEGRVTRLLDRFCEITISSGEVAISRAEDIVEGEPCDYKIGDRVHCNVRRTNRGFIAEYVTKSDGFPSWLEARIRAEKNVPYHRNRVLENLRNMSAEERDEMTLRALRQSRFFLYTIWNNGHSVDEDDAPVWFRNWLNSLVPYIWDLVYDEDVSESVSQEAFCFLCCMQGDAIDKTKEYLLDAIFSPDDADFNYYWRGIAYAIGDARRDEQKVLIKLCARCIGEFGQTAIKLLSIALWRSERAMDALTDDEIVKILEAIPEWIEKGLRQVADPIDEHDVQKLAKKLKISEQNARLKTLWRKQLGLTAALELLLVVIRARVRKSDRVETAFALSGPIVVKLEKLLQKVTDYVLDHNCRLTSRVILKVDKPDGLYKVPDLLYALRLYLTGESAANRISVVGVEEKEEE